MKLFLVLVLILCSSVPSRSNPALAVLPVAAVGAVILGVTAGGLVTHMSQQPTGTYSVDASGLTAPVAVYNTCLMAGAQIALGYLSRVPVNLQKMYADGMMVGKPKLQALINSYFPTTAAPALNAITDKLGGVSLGGIYQITSLGIWQYTGMVAPRLTVMAYQLTGPPSVVWRYFEVLELFGDNGGYYKYRDIALSSNPGPVPVSGPPSALSSAQALGLAGQIAMAATADAATRAELDAVIASSPAALIAAPVPITSADIAVYASAAAATAAQAEIDKLKAAAIANPTDLAAQRAYDQAVADQAEKAATELKDQAEKAADTYPTISSIAFTTAYNPGEFDIPSRFTTFLDTVKSSPLFSFSNSFFNSLPGGGSPIYEIEAGRYGHHSVDLSLTMSVGLAVLKTILLAIFGFLSIRAVIMKR